MTNRPDTFQALFAQLGGTRCVADALGLPYNTASKMRLRNSVSARHWPRLIALARGRGLALTVADLNEMWIKSREAA